MILKKFLCFSLALVHTSSKVRYEPAAKELLKLLEISDPVPVTPEDKVWLNSPPVGREII